MNIDIDDVITRLKKCLPTYEEGKTIALHEPCFKGHEWDYVKNCLDSGWVSSAGYYVGEFEKRLAEFTQIPYVIATVNGTAALHLCLKLAGVQPEDEVLTPALTFVATTNAIDYCQAIPHFVDSSLSTLGVDAAKLEDYLAQIAICQNQVCYNKYTNRPIRALVVMHVFGHPVELDALSELCQRYHLVLIEDAAEALGSYYQGQHVGQHGLLSALSFNGNKIITTGGGGAIMTHDTNLAKQARHISTTAKIPHAWAFHHDVVGYNYRLPNLNAALGCAQLEQLPTMLQAKRQLATRYQSAFSDCQEIYIIKEPKYCQSNYWLNALYLPNGTFEQQQVLLTQMNAQGIMTRPVWELQSALPMYQSMPYMDLTIATQLAERLINIPSSSFL